MLELKEKVLLIEKSCGGNSVWNYKLTNLANVVVVNNAIVNNNYGNFKVLQEFWNINYGSNITVGANCIKDVLILDDKEGSMQVAIDLVSDLNSKVGEEIFRSFYVDYYKKYFIICK